MSHPLTNFKIQNFYQNKPKLNGVSTIFLNKHQVNWNQPQICFSYVSALKYA